MLITLVDKRNGNNSYLEDKTINWRAKGIIQYMMFSFHGAEISLFDTDVLLKTADSEKTVFKEIRTLIKKGYIKKETIKNNEYWKIHDVAIEVTEEEEWDMMHPFTKLQKVIGDKAKKVIPVIGKNQIDVDFIAFILEDRQIVKRLKDIDNPAGYIVKLSKSDQWRIFQQKKFITGGTDDNKFR